MKIARPRDSRRLGFESLEQRLALAGDWQNPFQATDVDGNGGVSTPADALLVINELTNPQVSDRKTGKLAPLDSGELPPPFVDVDGNDRISPMDALLVVNALKSQPALIGAAAHATNPPELVAPLPERFIRANQGYWLDVKQFFADADAGDELTFSAAYPTWMRFDAETGILRGVPSDDPEDAGRFTVAVQATDLAYQSVTRSTSVSVDRFYVAGRVFDDLDGNGFQDHRELGTPNVEVSISRIGTLGTPTEVATTRTSLDGNYAFDGLTAGTYRLEVESTSLGSPTADPDSKANPLLVPDFVTQFSLNLTDPLVQRELDFGHFRDLRNLPPELIAPIPTQTIGQNETQSFDVSGFFVDPEGDELEFSFQFADGVTRDWLQVDENGTFTADGPRSSGPVNVLVSASDANRGVDAQFTINVQAGAVPNPKHSPPVIETHRNCELREPTSGRPFTVTGATWLSPDPNANRLVGTPTTDGTFFVEYRIGGQVFELTINVRPNRPLRRNAIEPIDVQPVLAAMRADTSVELGLDQFFEEPDRCDRPLVFDDRHLPSWVTLRQELGDDPARRDAQLTFRPTENQVGSHEIIVPVRNRNGMPADKPLRFRVQVISANAALPRAAASAIAAVGTSRSPLTDEVVLFDSDADREHTNPLDWAGFEVSNSAARSCGQAAPNSGHAEPNNLALYNENDDPFVCFLSGSDFDA